MGEHKFAYSVVLAVLFVVLVLGWTNVFGPLLGGRSPAPSGRFSATTLSTVIYSTTVVSSTVTTSIPGFEDSPFPPVSECEQKCPNVYLRCGESGRSCTGGPHCHGPPPAVIGWIPDWLLEDTICPPECTICMPQTYCDAMGIEGGTYTHDDFRERFRACYGDSGMTEESLDVCCVFMHEYSHACDSRDNKACREDYANSNQRICLGNLIDYYCAGQNPRWGVEQCRRICTGLAGASAGFTWDSCLCQKTGSTSGVASEKICCSCYDECLNHAKSPCSINYQLPESCNAFFPASGPCPTIPPQKCYNSAAVGTHSCGYYSGPSDFDPNNCPTTTSTTRTTTTTTSTSTSTTRITTSTVLLCETYESYRLGCLGRCPPGTRCTYTPGRCVCATTSTTQTTTTVPLPLCESAEGYSNGCVGRCPGGSTCSYTPGRCVCVTTTTLGVCCNKDGSGACALSSYNACISYGHTWLGYPSCSPNPCPASTPTLVTSSTIIGQ